MNALRITLALSMIVVAAPAWGGFILVDDMEGLDNWTATVDGGSAGIVADPANTSNNVFSIQNSNTQKDSARLVIPDIANNTTGTLFFRMRSTSVGGAGAEKVDWVAGSSDMADSDDWGDYEGYIRLAEDITPGDIDVDVRNGGSFSEVGPAAPDTWYNVWLVLDNTNDETDVYFNTGTADATSAGTESFTSAGFRNGTANPLIRLMVVNNENGTTGYIDDVYIDTSGENLTNPTAVPEPSTLLLGALALLGLAGFGWRKRA